MSFASFRRARSNVCIRTDEEAELTDNTPKLTQQDARWADLQHGPNQGGNS